MIYSEAKFGRVFILRLEHGDIIHETIENFAKEKNIKSAGVIAVGAVDRGSKLVVGPEKGDARPINPMEYTINNVYEVSGTGTLILDGDDNPMLHMHLSCGRGENALVGCIRKGVVVWQILEVIIYEIVGTSAKRVFDKELGFHTFSI